MGGERIERYWSYQMKSLLERYRQFETLIPAAHGRGAAHRGEDGRYVESILKETLKKFLPTGVEILSGFILRAGVESSMSGKARKRDEDKHSSQLDLIAYDVHNYPVYQRFGDTAVVLPEGVLGVISVKKTLRADELSGEIGALKKASQLCSLLERKGPFLALVGMDDDLGKESEECAKKIVKIIRNVFTQNTEEQACYEPVSYEELPGFIGNLSKWTIHRRHGYEPETEKKSDNKKCRESAEYQMYIHKEEESHLGLQFLLKGILDVYYSDGRNHGKQPGFFSFPSGRSFDWKSDKIPCDMCPAQRISS